MSRELVVYLDQERVGMLGQSGDGRMAFVYDSLHVLPLSFSMPTREEPYGNKECRAFFGGLLPDDREREKLAAALGVTSRNDLRFLELIGGECAGAVSLYPEGEEPKTTFAQALMPYGRMLSTDGLERILSQLKKTPLLTGEDVRLSLAGAQPKVALQRDDAGNFYVPDLYHLSTHILKPPHDIFPDTVENELFCMRLAKGSEIANTLPETGYLGLNGGGKAFVIRRYDRFPNDNGQFSRIHQEDFCQALSILPEHRYQNEGGPSVKDSLDLIGKTCVAFDKVQFLKLVCFNYLIGNNDAHGKNFSLLHLKKEKEHRFQSMLAPPYDLMCTEVYDGLARKMAMKIGDKYKPEDVFRRHWERLAQECDLSSKYVLGLLNDVAGSIERAIPAVIADLEQEGVSSPVFGRIAAVFHKRAEHISAY
jgi:serine/threonine-protein kinase HipA